MRQFRKWDDIPKHHDQDLRNLLGKCLHIMAYFDDPGYWDESDMGPEIENPTKHQKMFREEMRKNILREDTKENWRRMADRLLMDVGTTNGIEIKRA